MMKPTLIALAALTAFDAVATGGTYTRETVRIFSHLIRTILNMGWSMSIT